MPIFMLFQTEIIFARILVTCRHNIKLYMIRRNEKGVENFWGKDWFGCKVMDECLEGGLGKFGEKMGTVGRFGEKFLFWTLKIEGSPLKVHVDSKPSPVVLKLCATVY